MSYLVVFVGNNKNVSPPFFVWPPTYLWRHMSTRQYIPCVQVTLQVHSNVVTLLTKYNNYLISFIWIVYSLFNSSVQPYFFGINFWSDFSPSFSGSETLRQAPLGFLFYFPLLHFLFILFVCTYTILNLVEKKRKKQNETKTNDKVTHLLFSFQYLFTLRSDEIMH